MIKINHYPRECWFWNFEKIKTTTTNKLFAVFILNEESPQLTCDLCSDRWRKKTIPSRNYLKNWARALYCLLDVGPSLSLSVCVVSAPHTPSNSGQVTSLNQIKLFRNHFEPFSDDVRVCAMRACVCLPLPHTPKILFRLQVSNKSNSSEIVYKQTEPYRPRIQGKFSCERYEKSK